MGYEEAKTHLPFCTEMELHNTSPVVNAVLMLLRNGEDPKKVLDSVLVNREKEIKGYQNLLKKYP